MPYPSRLGVPKSMAPSGRHLQLTAVAGGRVPPATIEDSGDMEEVRLLDSYEDGNSDNFVKVEEGMRRIQLTVTGMTCAACSNSVEAALKSVNGILAASVALLQNKADVVLDPSLVKVSVNNFVSKFSFSLAINLDLG